MNGIEILATQKVATAWTCDYTAIWITVSIIMAISVVAGIWSAIEECAPALFPICIFVGVLVSLFACAMIMSTTEIPTEYETQYKVTISDEVSMNEFLDKYEIISQEGQIYTIREKE